MRGGKQGKEEEKQEGGMRGFMAHRKWISSKQKRRCFMA
jgi:hypothetical protein